MPIFTVFRPSISRACQKRFAFLRNLNLSADEGVSEDFQEPARSDEESARRFRGFWTAAACRFGESPTVFAAFFREPARSDQGVSAVPSLCWNVVQSGTFRVTFCAGMRAFFGIRLLPPAVWEGFRLTEYGCGIRLPTSVRPRHALSEAPGRPRQKVALGLPMTS